MVSWAATQQLANQIFTLLLHTIEDTCVCPVAYKFGCWTRPESREAWMAEITKLDKPMKV
jgi:hypothetical protein